MYSRVGVGLTGVLVVGLSVLAALGVCSLFGMWATLIILEVGPASVMTVVSFTFCSCSSCAYCVSSAQLQSVLNVSKYMSPGVALRH